MATKNRNPAYDGTTLSGAHIGDNAHASLVGRGDADWLFISAHALEAVSGTWTASYASNVPISTRTSAAATEVATFNLEALRAQDPKFRQARVKALKLAYSVDTADLTNLLIELVSINAPGNGSIPVGAVVAGDADADYDAAHNTAAKRGLDTAAPEEHTLLMTIPSSDRVRIDGNDGMVARLTATDPGTSDLLVKGLWVQLDHIDGA